MTHVPGEDDLCHFRYRVGDEVIHQIMAVAVDFLSTLWPDQRRAAQSPMASSNPPIRATRAAPTPARTARPSALREADRQALGEQLQSGAKRLQLTCPFPEVVDKVREATAKKGHPKDPKVTLLEIETVPEDKASTAQIANTWPRCSGLAEDEVPPVRLKWCHLSQGPQRRARGQLPQDALGPRGQSRRPRRHQGPLQERRSLWLRASQNHRSQPGAWLWNCPWATPPTRPTPMRAPSLSRIAPHSPSRCGLGRCSWGTRPMTSPPTTSGFMSAALSPSLPITGATSTSMRRLLLNRGYDQNGTPYAPCGRLCHSNGYDYQAAEPTVCLRPPVSPRGAAALPAPLRRPGLLVTA